MEASSSRAGATGAREGAGRTLAQTFCLVTGIVLILVGVLGFIFGGSAFNVGTVVEGENFIVFEVNGWHNIVHLLTGVFLVAMASAPATAVTGAIVFGVLYLVVALWGFIATQNILFIASTNLADNLLHVALGILGLAVGLSARGMTDGASARGQAA
jgi:Domain of unknown function (DUF4383)